MSCAGAVPSRSKLDIAGESRLQISMPAPGGCRKSTYSRPRGNNYITPATMKPGLLASLLFSPVLSCSGLGRRLTRMSVVSEASELPANKMSHCTIVCPNSEPSDVLTAYPAIERKILPPAATESCRMRDDVRLCWGWLETAVCSQILSVLP